MNINFTEPVPVQFCAEDRHRLDTIITCLAAIIEQGRTAGTPFTVPAEAAQEPVEGELPGQVSFDEIAAPEVKQSDIQQKVVSLSAAGKKEQVREIIKAYADRVSAIPEDKFGEVWAKLTALEG